MEKNILFDFNNRSRSLPPRSQTIPIDIDFGAAKRNPAGQLSVPGGIDFSGAKRNPEGRLCFMKEKFVETMSKSPIMKCTIKTVEVCPYLYNVEFKPVQEQVRIINIGIDNFLAFNHHFEFPLTN